MRDSYRPTGETINTRCYDVAAIEDDSTAKTFVLSHHYAGTYPAARFRFGIYSAGALAGVAVFSVPCSNAVLTNVFPCKPTDACELGRFVLLDSVPGNGETWFLARCFELLRAIGIAGVVSFSDPARRTNVHGETVFGGHIGTIYQAHNGVYVGRGKARTLRLLPNGTVLSDRSIAKLRAGDARWKSAIKPLLAFGAEDPGDNFAQLPDAERHRWAGRWIDRLTRPLRHPGNHKYAWAIDKRLRRCLPTGRAYPKSAKVGVAA
ncbi:MAG TPA: hypothetical protein VF595_17515 [Tepidisphaeraceae bacterium]|jgi:hypothetical protein